MTIEIQGRRSVTGEPIWVNADELPAKFCSAVTADGTVYPAQPKENGVLAVVDIDSAHTISAELADVPAKGGVELRLAEDRQALDVLIRGKLFTSYVYGRGFLKPYLGPVYASSGASYTRLDLETREHPHQRSVFIAVGDVNGIDFWNEYEETRGEQRHTGFERITSGPAWGGFAAGLVWCDHKGRPVLDETRAFTFYNQPETCRYIDVETTFTAAYGDIRFGGTKEAGPLGIRVNEEMRADRGGRFVNAYGLFAANNLYFKGGLEICRHSSLSYKFRLCFYENELNTSDRFLVYAK